MFLPKESLVPLSTILLSFPGTGRLSLDDGLQLSLLEFFENMVRSVLILILKLVIVFIASVLLYIFFAAIFSLLFHGKCDIKDSVDNSIAFAVLWVLIMGYKWIKRRQV